MKSKQLAPLVILFLSLFSLSAQTPRVLWTNSVSHEERAGLIDIDDDGVFEVYRQDGNVIQFLKGSDGTVKRELRLPESIGQWHLEQWEIGQLSMRRNRSKDSVAIYLSEADNSVIVREQRLDGSPRWQTKPLKVNSTYFYLSRLASSHQPWDIVLVSYQRTQSGQLSYSTTYRIDGESGQVMWRKTYRPDENAGYTSVIDLENDGEKDVLHYFPDRLDVLNSLTGRLKWRLNPPMPAPGMRLLSYPNAPFTSGQSRKRDLILMWEDISWPWSGYQDHAIQSFDTFTKRLKWQRTCTFYPMTGQQIDRDPGTEAVMGSVRLTNSLPYGYVTDVEVIDEATGKTQWTNTFEGWQTYPWFIDVDHDGISDVVYSRELENRTQLFAVDGRNGQEKWRFNFDTNYFRMDPALYLSMTTDGSGTTVFRDVDGDGRPDILAYGYRRSDGTYYGYERFLQLYDVTTGRLKWALAEPTFGYYVESIVNMDSDRAPEFFFEGWGYEEGKRIFGVLDVGH